MKTIFSQKPVLAFNNALFAQFEQRLLSAKNRFSPSEWALGVLPALYGPTAAKYLFKSFFSANDLQGEKGFLSVLEEKQRADVSEKKFVPPLNKLSFLNSLDLIDAQAGKFSFTNQAEKTIVFASIRRAKARFFDLSQAGLV